MKTALLLHGAICAAALGICLAYPAAGRDVLLVPIRGAAASHVLRSQDSGSFALFGGGLIPGSLHVRFAHSPALLPLLRSGVLPIAVPTFLCSTGQVPT
jgi:hypothetical protein